MRSKLLGRCFHSRPALGTAIVAILTTVGAASPAVCAILTVDTLSTEAPVVNGNCTLIEAIQAANSDVAVDACLAGNGEDEVRLPAGEMVFTVPFAGGSSALPAIDVFITIRGTGTAPTVLRRSSSANFRFFDVGVGPGAILALVHLELRGGLVVGEDGGAVRSRSASLELTDCLLRDNRAASFVILRGSETTEGVFGGNGGAIFAGGGLSVRRSTFLGNGADESGGAVFADGDSRIDESSFIGNIADEFGGGVALVAAPGDEAVAQIANSTFVGNRSGADGGAIATRNTALGGDSFLAAELSFLTVVDNSSAGGASAVGGILAASPAVRLTGILALRNQSKVGGSDVGGSLTSDGANIVAVSAASGFGASDLLASTPDLGTFVDAGTPGGGHVPLLPGTAPVDFGFGRTALCPPVDQLGQPRPPESCDAGAFELQGGGGQPVEVPTLSTLGARQCWLVVLGLLATKRLSTS